MENQSSNVFYTNSAKISVGAFDAVIEFFQSLPESKVDNNETETVKSKIATIVMSHEHFNAFVNAINSMKVKKEPLPK